MPFNKVFFEDLELTWRNFTKEQRGPENLVSIFLKWDPVDAPNLQSNKLSSWLCYRPQRSSGKVMFSQASVTLFTGADVLGGGHAW